MSKDIKEYDMLDKAKFGDDLMFDASALPNNTTLNSDVFQFGQSQISLGLTVVANTSIVIADTKILKIELLHDSEKDGSFASSVIIYDKTASGAETIALGTELVNYVPNEDVKQYCKLKVTTDSDLSTYKIDSWTYQIPR